MSEIANNTAAKDILFDQAFPGDIFFSRNYGPISWLIRKFTGFKYSHVFVKLSSNQVIESDTKGIKISNAKIYLNSISTVLEKISLPDSVDSVAFINYLTSKVGKKYDYGLLLGHLLSKIFKITRWGENILNAANRYTCSEYVSEALSQAGMIFKFKPSQITPKELYYALKGSNKSRESLKE